MSKLFFYDSETTGLPVWQDPSHYKTQPHIVQLAAILCDAETGNVENMLDMIIKPDGWEIPEEMTEIHGISNERAFEVGVDESIALDAFLELRAAWPRVAHNRTFDQRIIRIAISRFRKGNGEERDKWALKDDHECTMLMCPRHGCKTKKLVEAYDHFIGGPLEDNHSALADTVACMKIYFAMREMEVI